MENDITFLGKIIRVDSNVVEVEISDNIPSASPIIEGKVYKIGQIGTFVKIPIGNVVSYGIVSSVSNTPSKINDTEIKQEIGSRFLSVNLVGEKIGSGNFEKGIGLYPTINDEVHIVTESDLEDIYGKGSQGSTSIGKHSSSDNLDVFVDLHKLVLRHAAILGSTGSGKSNATVGIIKRIINDYTNSRMVLIDPHGEYASSFPEAKVFKINDEQNPLYIPFWLMNFDELAFFLVGAKPTDDQRPEYRLLRELIVQYKKESSKLKAGDVDEDYVTADSPIPFSARKLWHEMNWWLNASFSSTKKDEQTKKNSEQFINKLDDQTMDYGDPEELRGAKFQSHLETPSNTAPYKSQHNEFYSYEKKIISRLRDSRYNFMFHPGDYRSADSPKDLHDLLIDWIGNEQRLTILDLSNVPFEVLDITVGLITRFVYDSMFWGRNELSTGKNRPLFLAYDEAHSYLGKNEAISYARVAVEKIFKEGRKFGLGALVISQRPSEISETILAQVGTFIALRLTNSTDKSIVKSLAPDNMNSLIDLLPTLRIGEAIVVGEAIKIPSRIRVPLQNPRAESDDPKLIEKWENEFSVDLQCYQRVVTKIREQRL
ncbi:helicase HerA-like domain-containing protein [Paenibacillus sp. 2003]|uniref:ATP-binding protein n=1 Tax=Paenibacillus TaxID=44249 RepID=UPI00286354B8|nr:helicase HerA-like domain-containing protein [Paenibacillus sp. 2003]MDR6715635.1 DNA helicase HerA-like ATPase [Paenibacillus sp. 2003]